MEIVKCPNHPKSTCLLKTGSKSGATQGRSFYVCPQCGYSITTKLPPIQCLEHPSKMVELQSIQPVTVEGVKICNRKYYRCLDRKEGQSWCGFVELEKVPSASPDYGMSLKSSTVPKASHEGTRDSSNSESASGNASNAQHKETVSSSNDENISEAVNMSGIVESTRSEAVNMSGVVESTSSESLSAKTSELSFADLSMSYSESVKSKDQKKEDLKLDSISFKNYRDSPKPSSRPKDLSNKLIGLEKDNPCENISLARPFSTQSTQSSLMDLKFLQKALPSASVDSKDGKNEPKAVKPGESVEQSIVNSGPESSLKGQNEPKAVKPGESVEKAIVISEPESSLKAKSHNTVQFDVNRNTVSIKESLQSLLSRKQAYSSELHKIQASLRAVNLSNLPDKGERILNKLSHTEEQIKDIDRQIMALPKEEKPLNSCPTISQINIVKPPDQSREGTEEKQKGLAQKPLEQSQWYPPANYTHLPEHFQQMLASNPQAMTLYGGRMTTQRMREVGSITTEAIEKIHKQLESCPSENLELPDPKGLKIPLMPHQRHALAWLSWREKQHPPGGILADDMGLGKTLTLLSHILNQKVALDTEDQTAWLNRKKEVEKLEKGLKKSRATFIITPASLIHQWAKEIDRRFQPGLLKYILYHGPDREKNIHKLLDVDIVLSTYQIVAKEVGADKKENAETPIVDAEDKTQGEVLPMLLRIGWERIVLDEAHNIKNHKCATAMAICKLRCLSRWALTGTPIQNDLTDMYALLRFLRFSPFDEYKVWKKHVDSAKGSTTRLNTIVKALLLRRTKDQTNQEGKLLVSLPSRSKETILMELAPEERAVYDKLFRKTQTTVQAFVDRHQDKNDNQDSTRSSHQPSSQVRPGPGANFDVNPVVPSKATGSQILVLLLRLQQCCSHLSLMKSQLDAEILEADGIEMSIEEQMRGMILDEIGGESQVAAADKKAELFEKSSLSTKLKFVLDKLKSLQSKNSQISQKCVIVSQWTQMLDIIAYHLEKSKIAFSIIQGNVPPKKRMDIVDDFNLNPTGAQVMLLSLKAGGVGLNLTGGNHLFILDTHWNPALEEQACDRIYRMGQQKDVFIYRFVCKDTIEEKISNLQKEKLSLAKSVLSGSGAKGQKLTLHDLQSLFGIN